MAICDFCKQEMTDNVGCIGAGFDINDKHLDPIPNDEGQNCHDCGAPDGTLHHPGCDSERCPNCGGQAIGCDCEDSQP